MASLKQKIIAGILSGALILGGSMAVNSVYADPPSGQHQRHERPQMTDEQLNEYAKSYAEYYGVNQAEIVAALKNNVHFEDIRMAATLAKLSGKSFSEVLAMKVDWRQVAEKLGVSREQMDDLRQSEMLEGLAERSKLDKKTVESLLKQNYEPHDIGIAGLIANASGKDVKSVLSKRKLNNSWEDVAKEMGVDLQKIMPPGPGRERGQRR